MDNILDDIERTKDEAEHDDERELLLDDEDEAVFVVRWVRETF